MRPNILERKDRLEKAGGIRARRPLSVFLRFFAVKFRVIRRRGRCYHTLNKNKIGESFVE